MRRPVFAAAGNLGGHTDAVNADFVRQYIGPRLWPDGPFFTEAGEAMPDGTTDIPAPDGPPDIPAIMAVAEKAGMTILAPEGAPA